MSCHPATDDKVSRNELTEKIEQTQLGLQVVTTQTRSLREEMADTTRYLREEMADT
jgi:chaperonin cofactor prefoldin